MNPIVHRLDVSTRDEQRFRSEIEVPNPVGSILVIAFPRWSPGSYLIREPRRLVHDLRAWAIISGKEIDCAN